ncbi:glycoside hydrolase family 18 protein [Chitinilyticum piscinae]|uniref:chitinase n=1 Tax=Chitinilyticum piscinae TaxID=2866724 RepID=A0A8J7K0Y2_9NEIS|nr:glycoside hydrolase family 18 protein [Chitinilyticum piscinae]MBE9608456.1 glycoside hydrolase family 18 protein [Chitinilyticum piscinae]
MKLLLLPALLAAAFAQAGEPVFTEDFESGDLNAKWVGQNGDGSVPMHVSIVDDPLRPGNKVARFDKPVFGGDIFSKVTLPEGKYIIKFDYLGMCGNDCGGTVGTTTDFPGRDKWIAGTAKSGFPNRIKDSKKWESYEFDFKLREPMHLAIEQWVQSNGEGKDIYFDNIQILTDDGKPAAEAKPAAAAVVANAVAAPAKPQWVGYFTAWGHGDGFYVKNIETSGQAKKLTVINYAFANVVNNKCVIGQPDDDYLKPIPSEYTLDGKEDKGDNGLFGHWNQLKQLKKANPNLKVVISLGGWTWSKYFSDAALPANREAFVKSCVDQFVKGDVEKGGKIVPGLAKGVFDGIDIDWEYPGSSGNAGNIVRAEDTENYTALLQEFRKQLNAVDKNLLLTIAAPAPSSKTATIELNKIHAPLNWINIMTYDFSGGWSSVTGHNANLLGTKKDSGSVDGSVKDYLEAGVPANKIVVGVPFYGYGWKVSKTDNNGMYQAVSAKAKGRLEEGQDKYDVVKTKPGKLFRDEATQSAWKFDGKEVWTFDDADTMKAKVDFVKKNKLAGVMVWELSGDKTGELTTLIGNELAK